MFIYPSLDLLLEPFKFLLHLLLHFRLLHPGLPFLRLKYPPLILRQPRLQTERLFSLFLALQLIQQRVKAVRQRRSEEPREYFEVLVLLIEDDRLDVGGAFYSARDSFLGLEEGYETRQSQVLRLPRLVGGKPFFYR